MWVFSTCINIYLNFLNKFWIAFFLYFSRISFWKYFPQSIMSRSWLKSRIEYLHSALAGVHLFENAQLALIHRFLRKKNHLLSRFGMPILQYHWNTVRICAVSPGNIRSSHSLTRRTHCYWCQGCISDRTVPLVRLLYSAFKVSGFKKMLKLLSGKIFFALNHDW